MTMPTFGDRGLFQKFDHGGQYIISQSVWPSAGVRHRQIADDRPAHPRPEKSREQGQRQRGWNNAARSASSGADGRPLPERPGGGPYGPAGLGWRAIQTTLGGVSGNRKSPDDVLQAADQSETESRPTKRPVAAMSGCCHRLRRVLRSEVVMAFSSNHLMLGPVVSIRFRWSISGLQDGIQCSSSLRVELRHAASAWHTLRRTASG